MLERPGPARVALLQPFWDFFEDAAPGDLRADREATLAEIAAWLGPQVCAQETFDGREAAAAAGRRVAAQRPHALVVAMGMAVPPAFALAALEALPSLPLVVLVLSRRSSYGASYSHADITVEGGTVGGTQLTSSLHRRARPHSVIVVALDDARDRDRLSGAVLAATAAGRLRESRIGRVGKPIDGYDCVDCDPAALREAIGVELVDIEPAAIREAFLAAGDDDAEAVGRETLAGFEPAPGLAGEPSFERTVRMAAALQTLDRDLELDAGAMNCHVPEIRFAPDPGPGLAPCFALGRETSAGIPWACAGDVPTAVAMLTAKLLGGAALYHEVEGLDRATGEALLANSGEHDLAFADPAVVPALVRNRWWEGDRCPGLCARFGPPAGPGTLIGFTPHPEARGGFRFVVAEGAFTERRLPDTGTPHAAFRFAGGDDVVAAWTRWARTGVNHHSAATPGHLGAAVAAVADHLGVECVQVSAAGPLST